MRASLRHWCLATELPTVGDVLHLEELDAAGAPTGRRVRVRVEATPADLPHRPSSTQRLFAVDAPRDPPRLCRCSHIRILHKREAGGHRGACTLCDDEDKCATYAPVDPREEP